MNSFTFRLARLKGLHTLCLTLPLTLSSSLVMAYERDHEAHEHGHGQLLIAIEGEEVELLFTSPAMDIVGFEHAPSSAADKAAVEKARKQLEAGAELFVFNSAAQCQLEHVDVESALLHEADEHEHHDEHAHEEEHEEKHEHAHEEEHDHEAGEAHSEFEAEYHFACASPDQFDSLSVELFSKFPALKDVEVQTAGPRGQQRIELNAGKTVVKF